MATPPSCQKYRNEPTKRGRGRVLLSRRGFAGGFKNALWVKLLPTAFLGIVTALVIFSPFGGASAIVPRLAVGGAMVAALFLVALRSPYASVIACFVFLSFLGLIRRLLIPAVGWTSYDPLLLVGPLTALALCVRLFVLERRRLAQDGLSAMVLAVLGLSLLETLNPRSGTPLSRVAGLLFVAAPIVWFFVGGALSRESLNRLFTAVLMLASIEAIYGLWQGFAGLPAWDFSWVQLGGYTALSIGGQIRAFGTLASSSEYAVFLGFGLVIAVSWYRRRKVLVLPLIGALAGALFLASTRSVFVLTLVAVVVMLGLRTGHLRIAVGVAIAGAGVAATLVLALGPDLTLAAASSGNPFVAHQISGIASPFDPKESTLLLHLQNVASGLYTAFHSPLGLGTAATNIAGEVANSANTEVDISNEFVALGLIGGSLFALIVAGTFARVGRVALVTREPGALAATGILIVALGQWLNGGYYAVAPLIWFIAGAYVKRAIGAPTPAFPPKETVLSVGPSRA